MNTEQNPDKSEKALRIGSVSDSFSIGDESKSIEVLNYYDGSVEISITEYGNEQSKMFTTEETQDLIDWLINNCR